MASTIVVGYDGGEGAAKALDTALALCQDIGADLVVVFGYGIPLPERQSADYRDALHELGEKFIKEAAARAEAAGVQVSTELVFEKAAKALADAAVKHDARAVVVGAHGEGPIKGALLGSTAHKLLHMSERPVLVVPAG
jgi:nucleotide-binding universal stress UspA family protein